MHKLFLSIFLVCFIQLNQLFSQEPLDTFQNKFSCKLWRFGSIAAGSAISLTWLSYEWYKPYSTGKFHFFNDGNEWGGMDKLGHTFTTYYTSKFLEEFLMPCYYPGEKDKVSKLSAFIPWGYMLTIETMDGFSNGWGFSLYDLAANTAGTFLYISNAHLYGFTLKFSYKNSSMATLRPEIFGKNLAENILKDYNGQVYWIGYSPFKENAKFSFVSFCLGYSIENYYTSHKDQHTLNQIYLAPDIQWTKIKTHKKWLLQTFKILDVIKLPFPSLLIQNGKYFLSFSGYE